MRKTGFYFLDSKKRNRSVQKWGRGERNVDLIRGVAAHITSPGNMKVPTAKAVADWTLTSTTKSSYNSITSHRVKPILCLPDEIKAWHIGRLNKYWLGLEMAGNVGLTSLRDRQIDKLFANAALYIVPRSKLYDFPLVWRERDEVLAGAHGVTGHGFCVSDSHWKADYPFGERVSELSERLIAACLRLDGKTFAPVTIKKPTKTAITVKTESGTKTTMPDLELLSVNGPFKVSGKTTNGEKFYYPDGSRLTVKPVSVPQ